MLNQFLAGAIFMAYLSVGLFFLRFWRRTQDRLFVFFAASFGLLAIERILLSLANASSETTPYIYAIRLVAFALIISGVLHKNRRID